MSQYDPLLDAILTGFGPKTLRWDAPASTGKGYPKGSATYERLERNVSTLRAREERADSLRVRRDPCPYCNTRADVHAEMGCRRRWG